MGMGITKHPVILAMCHSVVVCVQLESSFLRSGSWMLIMLTHCFSRRYTIIAQQALSDSTHMSIDLLCLKAVTSSDLSFLGN
jgi:hypothetical protein